MREALQEVFGSDFFWVIFKIVLISILSGFIGLERESLSKPAGIRTHILVGISAVLATICGEYVNELSGGDMGRIPSQLLPSIGFIGAGTILRDGFNVKGLTTAAGLWTCAGIGLSIGIGFYSGAAITTILVLVIYRFMGRVDEIAYEHSRVLDIYIEFESRRSIAPFISVLKQNNYKIVQMELNKSKKNKEELVNATLVLEVPEKTKHGIVIDLLREIPGIEYVEEI